MSARYQLEVLLRPPVELWSAAVAGLCAGLLALAPGYLMLTPSVAYLSAALLLLLSMKRLSEGLKITRYQRGLKRLSRYTLSSDRIPMRRNWMFLGRGFRWRQIHVQRLRDLRLPNGQDYLRPAWLYRWARKKQIAWENTFGLSRMAAFFAWDHVLNPLRPLPPVGGKPEIHAVGLLEGEDNVYERIAERVGHKLVVGTTRVGKTRFAEIGITQDIKRGDITIVFDPKGDAELMGRVWTESAKAGRPCYLFHLAYPDISARYNAIGHFERITEVATRATEKLPNQGNSAAFKEFSWRFVNIIARALHALGKRPDYTYIRRYINDIEPLFKEYAESYFERHHPGWETKVAVIASEVKEQSLPFALKGRSHILIAIMRFVQQEEIYDPVLEGLVSAFKYDRTYFDKIVSSLGPLLEKLTTGRAAELIAPDYFDLNDQRPIFDWMSVIQQGANVYVGLDALSDGVVAGAVGASMFADLTSIAGRIYNRGLDQGLPEIGLPKQSRRIALHADEFNELVGDQFIPLVNKAGGSSFQVTAYTQTVDDIVAGIGDLAKAGQILGNFNTLVMLRVKNETTAKLLCDQLPKVQVTQLTAMSSATDASSTEKGVHFTSSNQDRITTADVPMLEPGDLTSLPKGQAFALIDGGHLYKLRLPLPGGDYDLPADIEAMAAGMKQTHINVTPEHWYAGADNWRQEAA